MRFAHKPFFVQGVKFGANLIFTNFVFLKKLSPFAHHKPGNIFLKI